VNFHRGIVHLRRNDALLAEMDFDQVLERFPDLARAYVLRAEARQGMNHISKAIEDITHAIRLMPNHAELYYLRSVLRSKVGDHQGADMDRRRVLDTEPANAEGWTYRALLKSPSDPRGALADFDKALAFNPDSILTLYGKATLLSDVFKSNTEAVEGLDKVLRLDPHFVEARIKRGFLLAGLGKRDKAVADAEVSIRAEPTPHRHYQAASIYALTFRKDPLDKKRAIELLAYALRNGYGVKTYERDSYFASLRNLTEFRRLAEGLEILGAGDLPRMRP
jgi:tetratricopeptide (TPR) repeat protein